MAPPSFGPSGGRLSRTLSAGPQHASAILGSCRRQQNFVSIDQEEQDELTKTPLQDVVKVLLRLLEAHEVAMAVRLLGELGHIAEPVQVPVKREDLCNNVLSSPSEGLAELQLFAGVALSAVIPPPAAPFDAASNEMHLRPREPEGSPPELPAEAKTSDKGNDEPASPQIHKAKTVGFSSGVAGSTGSSDCLPEPTNNGEEERRNSTGSQEGDCIPGFVGADGGPTKLSVVPSEDCRNSIGSQLRSSSTAPRQSVSKWKGQKKRRKTVVQQIQAAVICPCLTKRPQTDPTTEIWLAQPSYRCILHPNSTYRSTVDVLSLLFILAEAVLVPFSLGFEAEVPLAISWTSAVFFSLELICNFFTGFFHDGVLIMRHPHIITHYLRTWFLVDLLSTFPWFCFEGGSNDSSASVLRFSKVGKFLRILRLLRVAKISMLVGALEEFLHSPALIISLKLTKILTLIVMLTHWTACIWGWIGHPDQSPDSVGPHPNEICEPDGPCEPSINGSPWRRRYGLDEMPIGTQYLHSLRFAAGLFTGADTGIQPGFWLERVFLVLALFASFIVLSTIISKIVIMFNKMNQEDADQDELMMQFKEFMAQSKVPYQLQAKVRRYLDYQYKSRRELQTRRFEMLDKLSPWLRKELTVVLNSNVLALHPFFNEVPYEVQPHICCGAKSILCAPGDVVLQLGQNSTSMYFLVRGRMSVSIPAPKDPTSSNTPLKFGRGRTMSPMSRAGTTNTAVTQLTEVDEEEEEEEKHMLEAPGYIGTDCLFDRVALKYTVVTISHCELLMIRSEDMYRLAEEFPSFREYITEAMTMSAAMRPEDWDMSKTTVLEKSPPE